MVSPVFGVLLMVTVRSASPSRSVLPGMTTSRSALREGARVASVSERIGVGMVTDSATEIWRLMIGEVDKLPDEGFTQIYMIMNY